MPDDEIFYCHSEGASATEESLHFIAKILRLRLRMTEHKKSEPALINQAVRFSVFVL